MKKTILIDCWTVDYLLESDYLATRWDRKQVDDVAGRICISYARKRVEKEKRSTRLWCGGHTAAPSTPTGKGSPAQNENMSYFTHGGNSSNLPLLSKTLLYGFLELL